MKANLRRISKQNQWLRNLCSVEEAALGMVRPIDLVHCDPEILVCNKGLSRAVHDYWRVVLSSEPQGVAFSGGGREIALLIRDRVSGGFMGVVGLSDPPTHWTQLIDYLGWKENAHLRLAHQHRIFMMRRCLPLYEFGQMTGGKLLALVATSRELIRLLELRYSYQFLFFGIRTLHGKGSQYNRLQQRGIELINVDESNHGFYGMELRKKAVSFLRGEADDYGKTSTYPIKEQVTYWQKRWLTTRMKSLNVGSLITPDPEKYRLSAMLSAKKMTMTPTMEIDDNGFETEQE